MWRHYVYVHRRADDGRVFYVGKGSHPHRSSDRSSRNPHWQRIVEKHGLAIEIVAKFETDQLAQQCERDLIAHYGRELLANLTDGGDGCAGINPTAQTRAKLSDAAKRPRSDAWVRSIRLARKAGGNGGVVRHGDKLSREWRDSLAAAKVGTLNPMYGKTGAAHHNSRRVKDAVTGEVFDSVLIAATVKGHKMKTLYNWLSGHRPNPTSLEFA
jgi:NUMOD3 motif